MAKRRKRAASSAAPTRRRRRTRRHRSMSEPGRRTRRRSGTRRRRSRRGLSEIFSPGTFKTSGLANLHGLGGGAISNLIDRMGAGSSSPLLRGVIQVGGAMVVSAGLGMHNVAAGMSGGYGYSLLDELMGSPAMSEDYDDADYADDDSMSEYPDALDEDNNPMFLAEDGNLYYLEEYELADDGTMYLAESGIARMYPDYVQNP